MKFLPIYCLIFVLLLSSCASTKQNEAIFDDLSTEKISLKGEHSVLNGSWQLVSFTKDGINVPIVTDTAPNVIGINFYPPKNDVFPVNGFLGVNLFFDGYVEVKDNKKNREDDKKFIGKQFAFNEVTTTLRTGPDEHMAFEDNFKKCLFTSDSLSLDGKDTIIIDSSESKSELIFNRLKK